MDFLSGFRYRRPSEKRWFEITELNLTNVENELLAEPDEQVQASLVEALGAA